MTVLTFAGAVKPDKAPLLVDCSTLSYRPDRLEDGSSNVGGGSSRRAFKTVALLFASVAFVLFVLCDAYNRNVAYSNTQRRYAALRKSYAAAENDTPSAAPDRDAVTPGPNINDVVPPVLIINDAVPPGPIITDAARFIHDFSVNVTGIVDVPAKRCFVMPLSRRTVAPPKSLNDLLFKMSTGYYSTDMRRAVAGMHVVRPPVDDLSRYGLYISKDCAGYSTYMLSSVVPAS